MKKLYDYLFGNDRLELPHYNTTLEEFCDKNNINIDNITEDQLNVFYYRKREDLHCASAKQVYLDNIVETLTSYSGKRLADRLQNIIGDHGEVAFNDTDKPHTIIIFLKDNYLLNTNSFVDFTLSDTNVSELLLFELSRFNYHISEISKTGTDDFIVIEPRYSEDVTQILRSKTNVFYHVTKKSNVSKILKRGLTPKVGKTRRSGGYRYFPEKVFLIAESENIRQDINEIVRDKYYNDFAIIKIDLTGHNVGLYKDDYYNKDNIVYTFEAIPPQILSVVKFEDIV